ncbi:MAG: hypothetical protein C0485_10850 [Pirellula sp.]|nr:hypothetical protein [Pirellula sp.]
MFPQALRSRSGRAMSIVPILIAALTGCGGGRHGAALSGTVTVGGVPLEKGKIVFRPVDPALGNGGSADVIEGSYQLEGVSIGQCVFTFSGSKLTGRSITGPGGAPEPERANVIPQQALRDGVEREITESGTQDFSLEGPA